MPLNIQKAGSLDVSIANPRDILYIRGNETTDGSIRFHFLGEPGETEAHVELRASGVWNDTGMIFSAGSINLGRDLRVSAVLEFLQTFNASADPLLLTRSLYGHIPYHPFSGTEPNLTPPLTGMPIMPVLDFPVLFDVFPPFTPDNDITGTTISIIFPTLSARVLTDSQHQTGGVAASAPVEITYTKNGVILTRFNIPASQMPASSLLELKFDEDFGLEGSGIVQTFTSDNLFSLSRNAANDIITRHDGFPKSTVDIILEEFVVTDDLSIVFDNNASFVVNNRF